MAYYGKIFNCKLHMPISNQLTAGHLNQSNWCEEMETERSTVCTGCCRGCSPAYWCCCLDCWGFCCCPYCWGCCSCQYWPYCSCHLPCCGQSPFVLSLDPALYAKVSQRHSGIVHLASCPYDTRPLGIIDHLGNWCHQRLVGTHTASPVSIYKHHLDS